MIQSPALPEAPSSNCLNCGAALLADQRYCLNCGQPASPVRLAFLDVLQGQRASQSQIVTPVAPNPYGPAPTWEQSGPVGALQRYSGLFGLLTVLLVAVVIGLLVGHWVSAGKTPTQSVYKIEGLSGLAAAAPAATTTAPTATSTAAEESTKAAGNSKEAKESEAAAKAPPATPKKTSTKTLSKLNGLKGKKYQQEINKLTEGDQPIETSGGGSSTSTPSKTAAPKETGKAGGGSGATSIE